MDYKRIYYDIIDKFKNTSGIIKTGEYFETHHIIPKCLGGTNDPTNLVNVPAREHIMLHLLLLKMYPDNAKIIFAANCMVGGVGYATQKQHRAEAITKFSTRTIGEVREAYKRSLAIKGIQYFNKKTKNYQVGFKSKCAVCYDENYKVIRLYDPVPSCKLDGFYYNSVCRACRTKAKYAGYYWSYEEEFSQSHLENLIEYKLSRENGILPELDTSYNRLTKTQRLLYRPKRVVSDETKKKQSIAMKGRKKALPKISKEEIQQKKVETMRRNNTHGGTPRIPVQAPDGKIYDNLTACGKAYNVNRHTIQKWAIQFPEKGFKLLPSPDIRKTNKY